MRGYVRLTILGIRTAICSYCANYATHMYDVKYDTRSIFAPSPHDIAILVRFVFGLETT